MSNFPADFDSDLTIPRIDDNLTEIGDRTINALRSAVFAIEETLGINVQGTASSLAVFLSVAHNPDGSIKPSILTSLGLVTLPITDVEISPTAGIQESKLALAHNTTSLFAFINQVNTSAQTGLNFIAGHGYKLEPHIQGIDFNHDISAIKVAPDSTGYFNNRYGIFRDNTNLYTLFGDTNNDLITHEVANGNPVVITSTGIQTGGTVPPTNYAHVSTGIFLDTSNFSFVPQTASDLQQFAEFIDNSNIFILGTRIQTLYQNGIPRTSISSSLVDQSHGQQVIPPTSAVAYLLYAGGINGAASTPIDSIDNGDDLIEFTPPAANVTNNSFDALFAAVRVGDILTVNYGSFSVASIIVEIKYALGTGINPSKRYVVRTDRKNILAQSVTASVTRSLSNNEKFGVLALAQANHPMAGVLPSLVVGNPRGAEALSHDFNPNLIDNAHYNLYLSVYPTGNPLDQVVNLPAIDISGNQGSSPGAYTLDSVVQNINNEFRSPGFNNRFIAFQYQGELGIKLADSINNISFSIVDGVIDPTTGLYNRSSSNLLFPKNVIGVPGFDSIDASGLGPGHAAVSGPLFTSVYGTPQAAQTPAKIIAPLTRKNYYVNGIERERFAVEPATTLDGYGDSYWPATIITKVIHPGSRVEVTYQIPLNLSDANLQIGKTITVVPASLLGSSATFVDSGRYFISNIQFNNCLGCTGTISNITSTNITVYDAIQSPNGTTPYASAAIGTAVNLYFSADSVGFNSENASDVSAVSPFKRLMEMYVDSDGYTFSHERARMYIGNNNTALAAAFGSTYNGLVGVVVGSPAAQVPLFGDTSQTLITANIIEVSPKLTGFNFGQINKINLQLTSFDTSTGFFDGYLCNYNLVSGSPVVSNVGPVTTGKKGDITRFYDQTNVNYIDILFDLNDTVSAISNAYIDIQLFPTLRLDNDVMLLGTAQVNDASFTLRYLTDRRQFGNVSTAQLSDEAINFIQAGDKYLEQNGVVRGFDLVTNSSNQISLAGGLALVNGKFVSMNDALVTIPFVKETYLATQYNVNWLLCVNDQSEFDVIPLTDFDSVLATPNAPNRLFTALDVVNSQTYPLDSTTFVNLLNDRKDLTPLYLVASTVSGTGNSATVTLSVQDMRKYVIDGNSLNVPTLTDQFTQGNFRNFGSALLWFKYNAAYQNTLYLKSSVTLTADPGLSSLPLTIAGLGNTTTLIIDTACSFSNVTFQNVTFVLNNTITVNKCTFLNCTFLANNGGSQVPTAIQLATNAIDVEFIGCTANYVPNTSSGYTSGNLVNSSHGFIYCNVGTVHNIAISDCSFTTNTATRFPFISFEYNAISAIAQNIAISHNTFYNTSTSDDMAAVIAFTSNQPGVTQPTEGMKLINCVMDGNSCDKNQLISVSSVGNGASPNIITNLINAVGLTIQNNLCGTISALTSTDYDRNYESLSTGLSYGKATKVLINNNTCKYIGTLDGTGQFVGFNAGVLADSSTSPVGALATSPVIVSNNTASWIAFVGLVASSNAFDQNAYISILNNSLKAFNTSYLNTFFASPPSTIYNAGILLIANGGGFVIASTPNALIDGNNITSGQYLTTSTPITYSYDNAIYTFSSGPIINNTCDGLNASGTFITASSVNGNGNLISSNSLYRNSVVITSYMHLLGSCIVSNNFFDSTTIDGTSITLINGTLTNSIIKDNINYPSAHTLVQPILAMGPNPSGTNQGPMYMVAGQEGGIEAITVPSNGAVAFVPLTVLSSVPFNTKLAQIQVPMTWTGTANGNTQIGLSSSTNGTNTFIGNFSGPSGSSPQTVTIPTSIFVNNTTTSYWLTLTVFHAESATNVTFWSPILTFDAAVGN